MEILKDTTKLPERFPVLIRKLTLKEQDNDPERFHYHDFCEITHVQSGFGIYYINGTEYEVEPGDIIIFNQVEPHGWVVTERTMEVLVLTFAPEVVADPAESFYDEYLKPFLYLGSHFQNLISSMDDKTTDIYDIMEDIAREARHREKGYEGMIRSDILRILVLLMRHYEKDGEPLDINLNEKKRSMKRLERAIYYINSHYMDQITLEEVAALAYMSPNYFSSYFKNVTNRNFSEYLTMLRLNRVQELFMTTDRTVASIAMECGFRNMSNFYRLYKKHIGPLPQRKSKKR
ncbi:MAG: helix-turn-helix domain-containing protein [Lachnospiraceae bacterium]|nr:helix-turn-helix domain-containing protein [Lachnospiraceae bacterium]